MLDLVWPIRGRFGFLAMRDGFAIIHVIGHMWLTRTRSLAAEKCAVKSAFSKSFYY
jgi:hypothetical protein